MVLIKWHLYIYLFFIILTLKSPIVYSIQCCREITCLEKPVDCAENVCFKLVFKVTDYRGCMGDLIDYIDPKLHKANSPDDTGGSNDDCQKIGAPGDGMSLCKCTSNLCNSSSKYSYISYPVLILILFVVYQFPFVFRS